MLCYKFYKCLFIPPEYMRKTVNKECRNNGIFNVDRKQMWAVDGKQEIHLEWPYNNSSGESVHNEKYYGY